MCYTSQGIHTRVYVGNREQGRRFLANTERHVHAKGGGPQGPFANHPSAHRSLCVTVRMMRVFHAPSAHFSCAAAKADAVWSLSRIENTKQGMAELILIASVMPRGGARWEIGEPIVACVTDLSLVIEVQETRHGMHVVREQVKLECVRTGGSVHGARA